MKTVLMVIVSILFLTSCATPSQVSLDAEVKRLCAIDGGMKIYETVTLPESSFNRFGQINFYRPTQGENALGQEYLLRQEHHSLAKGNPRLARHHYQVLHRSDERLLGETILYGRGGGDLPGPWEGTGFTCPTYSEAGIVALLKKVFVPAFKGNQQ